jgi:hypothetical protein
MSGSSTPRGSELGMATPVRPAEREAATGGAPPALALFDHERLRAVLSGLIEPPPRVTLKSLVRDQLPEIRAARKRGWSIAQLAIALCAGGFLINEATLRKYLNQLERPKPRRPAQAKAVGPKKEASLEAAPPGAQPSPAPDLTASAPPRRSLLRRHAVPTPVLPLEKIDA